MLLLQWEHLFTTWQSSSSLVQRRSGLISEAEPWRYVRSPNRFATFWAAKTNHSDKNDFFIKMLLERSCEYDQVIIDHPDVPRLDDQAPRLIYIYICFSFQILSVRSFCSVYMRVYMHGWTIWGGSAASVGGYRVHCSLQSGENCMGSTWRLFLHHQEIPWFVPLGTAS